MPTDPRRLVPRTDSVLADPRLAAVRQELGDALVKDAVRRTQEQVRAGALAPDAVVDAVLAGRPAAATSLQPVLNATGVVLHTNLGRAPLSAAAVRALGVAAGYVDVEFDLASGARARRGRGMLDALLAAVPDAEDALVVNNGAAALVLAATALAGGREIVISRGELIEIGDGFRIPELLAATGVRLREVGTTNRTHLADYRDALGPDTAFVLKVHPSNFAVRGFTAAVSTRELAALDVPVVVDVGSGLLAAHPALPDEPDVDSALRDGAAVVTASGDKLLGGPQAGLVFGRRDVVQRMRRHPIARALRVDKLTAAALEATLTGPQSPTVAAVTIDPDELRGRAERMADALRESNIAAAAVPSDGRVGGGGAPEVLLAGWAVAVPAEWVQPLRRGRPAVVARVDQDRCLLDLRCVPADEDAQLIAAVRAVAGSDGRAP